MAAHISSHPPFPLGPSLCSIPALFHSHGSPCHDQGPRCYGLEISPNYCDGPFERGQQSKNIHVECHQLAPFLQRVSQPVNQPMDQIHTTDITGSLTSKPYGALNMVRVLATCVNTLVVAIYTHTLNTHFTSIHPKKFL